MNKHRGSTFDDPVPIDNGAASFGPAVGMNPIGEGLFVTQGGDNSVQEAGVEKRRHEDGDQERGEVPLGNAHEHSTEIERTRRTGIGQLAGNGCIAEEVDAAPQRVSKAGLAKEAEHVGGDEPDGYGGEAPGGIRIRDGNKRDHVSGV